MKIATRHRVRKLCLVIGLGALITDMGSMVLNWLYPPDRYVVLRKESPTRRYVALLEELNGGATTSFEYNIYVQSPGQPFTKKVFVGFLYGAVRNTFAYGVDLDWPSDNTLRVQYWRARATRIPSSVVRLDDQVIHIQVCPGIENDDAPRGGMFYALQKQRRAPDGR